MAGASPFSFTDFSALQLLKNHHYLLCTLVLWNAMAMEALPIFLDRLANPVTAVCLSVTVVLIFGVTPHCLRVMYLCCPLLVPAAHLDACSAINSHSSHLPLHLLLRSHISCMHCIHHL
jgi:hypothetical protein